MSIKKSLRIMLIIFSIVPLLIVSLFTFYFISNKLITMRHENLLQLVSTNGNTLEAMINTQMTEAALLSSRNETLNVIKMSNRNNNDSNTYPNIYNQAYSLLVKRKSMYAACKNITLYNKKKEVIISTSYDYKSLSDADARILEKINQSGSLICMAGRLTDTASDKIHLEITIGSPVMEERTGNITGYVITTLNNTYLESFLDSVSAGNGSYSMILDQDGSYVYHTDRDPNEEAPADGTLRSLYERYDQTKVPRQGIVHCKVDNSDQVFAYFIMPGLKWVLLTKLDISNVIETARFILLVLAIGGSTCLLFSLVISSVFTKRYTRPIFNMKDTMKAAAGGDLNVRCSIDSKNELGELAKSFNKMLHVIEINYDDLTSMHDLLLSNEEELRSNYKHIEYLAYHDTLTNLPNKLLFNDKVDSVLSSSPGDQQHHAVFFVDLDNFKTINDTLGHNYGDDLLKQTAEKLNSLIGPDDMLARAGGDEFLLFQNNIPSEEEALQFASHILTAFRTPFDLSGEVVYVSMSIGIAVYPKNGQTYKALVKNSDIAMYKSKDTGKNKFTLFNKSMEEELNRNTEILEVLRKAVVTGEVYLMYQPQVELKTNTIIGYEALMRINSSRLGPISPAEFIPIAEESGLIIELGTWVLREACIFNKSLIDSGFTPRAVSVNISSIQLNQPEFMNILKGVLEETGLPSRYLELEITESTLVASMTDAQTLLGTLQSLGVRVSLDDFGTGYSSLNYLTNLPIDTLKIDKSFIDNICLNDKDSFVAEMIISLAHRLNIKVIAEGVEENSQFHLLAEKNCDTIQGYLFSRPLLPEILIDLLSE